MQACNRLHMTSAITTTCEQLDLPRRIFTLIQCSHLAPNARSVKHNLVLQCFGSACLASFFDFVCRSFRICWRCPPLAAPSSNTFDNPYPCQNCQSQRNCCAWLHNTDSSSASDARSWQALPSNIANDNRSTPNCSPVTEQTVALNSAAPICRWNACANVLPMNYNQ